MIEENETTTYIQRSDDQEDQEDPEDQEIMMCATIWGHRASRGQRRNSFPAQGAEQMSYQNVTGGRSSEGGETAAAGGEIA